ncbi:hypothetical protein [Thermofilum pendens]|uniref:Transcriptional regulator n=1 Tax=Thermofilum pendens (strain DSM 2475 / Hrk 5) TaxID=368408 RepID=A1RY89_THEPD|nr:hypothetical protein [Thermofilum pendens]ABL78169.1 conserved hypothetical protein [Thermofilum pendens Hrk 5]
MGYELTTREKLFRFFLENPGSEIDLYQLTRELGLRPSDYKEVLENINHVAKTIRRKSNGKMLLMMKPPMCASCGYVFRELEKARLPSRCPVCKSERIRPPSFMLVVQE